MRIYAKKTPTDALGVNYYLYFTTWKCFTQNQDTVETQSQRISNENF